MAVYRYYRLDAQGRIRSGSYFEALDDAEAVRLLGQRVELHDCELWCETRRIAFVPAAVPPNPASRS